MTREEIDFDKYVDYVLLPNKEKQDGKNDSKTSEQLPRPTTERSANNSNPQHNERVPASQVSGSQINKINESG